MTSIILILIQMIMTQMIGQLLPGKVITITHIMKMIAIAIKTKNYLEKLTVISPHKELTVKNIFMTLNRVTKETIGI